MTTSGAPCALILSLRNWFGAVRLPKAFQRAGFDVVTVSYPNLLIGRCRSSRANLLLPDDGTDQELIATLRQILVAEQPKIVVPTDDASVELLQAVALDVRRELPEQDPLVGLLRDSLGDFASHAILRQRHRLAKLAAKIGVRAPMYSVIRTRDEAHAFAVQHDYSVVLKAEESYAGLGVAICHDAAQLDKGLTRIEARNPRLFAEGSLLQAFVPGRTAMRAVIAWRGKVVAGLSAFKLETHPGSTGPSTVVEFIEQPEMMGTAREMIAALGFSGFASLDFIVDEAGAAHLIELNPRPTPICHLGAHLGLDLCESLRLELEGKAVSEREPQGLPRKVSLFPQEWIRNPSSPHFADSFHDVPWEEPALLEGFVSLARTQMGWGEWQRQETRRERLRTVLPDSAGEQVARAEA